MIVISRADWLAKTINKNKMPYTRSRGDHFDFGADRPQVKVQRGTNQIARMSWLLGQGLAQPWSRLCHFECFVSFGFLLMANLVVAPRDTAGPCKGSSPWPTDEGRSGNEPRGKYILVIFFFNSHTCMFWLDFWWQMHILVVGCSPLTCCSLFSEIWTTTQRSRNTDYIYYIYHYYYYYPARARARRACALRALGLLLADGALTVGWGKTFWGIGRVPSRKRA